MFFLTAKKGLKQEINPRLFGPSRPDWSQCSSLADVSIKNAKCYPWVVKLSHV